MTCDQRFLQRHLVVVFGLVTIAGWAQAAAKPIIFTSPTGGEVMAPGSMHTIRLDPKTRYKSIEIRLSTDGGQTFDEVVGTIDNKIKDWAKRNTLAWTVPATPTTQAMLRAVSVGGRTVGSGSTSAFSIGTVPGIESPAAHGSLSGLDADDHPQYMRVDGTRPMTGALDVQANVTASKLVLRNTSNTNTSTVQASAVTANRTYSLPDADGELAVVLRKTEPLDFGTVTSFNHGDSADITVTGAAIGDAVMATPAVPLSGRIVWMGYVSAADTVKIRLRNTSAFDTDPDGAGTSWAIRVIK